MIYTIPQPSPDEVMRVIHAGIGDLGQSNAQREMGAGGAAAGAAVGTAMEMERAGSEPMKGTLKRKPQAGADRAANVQANQALVEESSASAR